MRENLTSGLTRGAGASLPLLYLFRLAAANSMPITAQSSSGCYVEYAAGFAIESGQGAPAIPFRTALGALIIKEKLGITDEETVMQIQETPYLQYLVGMQGYRDEAPFDPSMMTHFRKRISFEMISKVNEKIIAEERKKKLKMIRKLKKKKILR
jgi:hypothetical protein